MLQANTKYVIKLLDSPGTRNVVQVYDEDQTKLLTMFMGVSAQRMEPEDKTVFKFIETQPGFPLPIRTWFYPGRLTGLDFVYPKQQATEIAAHAKEPVLATNSKVELTAANIPSVEESAGPRRQPVPEKNAQIAQNEGNLKGEAEIQREKPSEQPNVAEQPAAAEQPSPAEPPSESEQRTTPEPAPQTEQLPQTAGELPLLGLIGMLCLGVGLGLKVLSARP
jgi:hypothetical protein